MKKGSRALVCVHLVGKTVEQMVGKMRRAKASGADLVEIRLDHLSALTPRQDLELLLKHRPLPAIVAYRSLQNLFDSIAGKRPEHFKVVIVSSHNYQNTPSVELLGNLVARTQATGADIVKIATTAVDISDVGTDVPSNGPLSSSNDRFGYGGREALSPEYFAPKFGGYLTYASLDDGGKESAPGQPTIRDLLNLYNIKELGTDTKIYGVNREASGSQQIASFAQCST